MPKIKQLLLISILAYFFPANWSLAAREICAARYQELFDSFEAKDPANFTPKAGIEIEGSISAKIDLEGVAEIVRRQISRPHRDVTLQIVSEPNTVSFKVHYKNYSGISKYWTIKEDASIEPGRNDHVGFEINTPVLESPEDFALVKQIVRTLKKSGAESEPASAGVHVHVDFSRAEGGDLAALAAIFSEIEKEIKNKFSIVPSRQTYIKNTSRPLTWALKYDPPTAPHHQYLYRLIELQDRHHALNLQAYQKFGTVEFRLFNSTLNPEALDLMTDFSMKLVHAIRTKNPKLVSYLTKKDDEIELDTLAKVLGMKLSNPNAKKVLEEILKESKKRGNPDYRQLSIEDRLFRDLGTLLSLSAMVVTLRDPLNLEIKD